MRLHRCIGPCFFIHHRTQNIEKCTLTNFLTCSPHLTTNCFPWDYHMHSLNHHSFTITEAGGIYTSWALYVHKQLQWTVNPNEGPGVTTSYYFLNTLQRGLLHMKTEKLYVNFITSFSHPLLNVNQCRTNLISWQVSFVVHFTQICILFPIVPTMSCRQWS